ncbi:MAG: GNAT family N-acetyltransferase [Paramuribaculum sp.]|nr:GNAT family N-acetyltransferase [Paramuribaculum sp.]
MKDMIKKLHFRRALSEDINAASIILKQAAQQMLDEGKHQWTHSYPTEVHVRADVERGVGYVLEDDKEIVGYCAVMFDGEPAYNNIEGNWLSYDRYVVVHRLAVRKDRKGTGLGRIFMETIENYAKDCDIYSFKIDTNFDNYHMLGLLNKLGFTYCGEVMYESGRRKAFEKRL